MPEYAIMGLFLGMILPYPIESWLRPCLKKHQRIQPDFLLSLVYLLVSAGVGYFLFAAAMNSKDLLDKHSVDFWFTLMQFISLLFPSSMAANCLKAWGEERSKKTN